MPIEVNPIIAYHGSDKKFKSFDDKKIGSSTDEGWLGQGHYFSTDKNVARTFKHVAENEVKLKNPYHIQMKSFSDDKKELIRNSLKLDKKASAIDVAKKLKELEHDGVILDYSPTGYNHKEIMALHGHQAKVKKWEDVPKTNFNKDK
jgi:hypothetical protein